MGVADTDLLAVDRAFGHVLRELRLAAGLSQERLGLDIGSGRTYISQLERGERGATLKTLFRVAGRLGVQPSEIVHQVESTVQRGRPGNYRRH